MRLLSSVAIMKLVCEPAGENTSGMHAFDPVLLLAFSDVSLDCSRSHCTDDTVKVTGTPEFFAVNLIRQKAFCALFASSCLNTS